MRLSDIRGQDRAIGLLQSAAEKQRIHHAYLFAGPAHVGKHSAALAFAAAANCQVDPVNGCGECASCVRIAELNHPDIRILSREGAAQIIPISVIRSQVLSVIGLPPHEAKLRFFLIEEATAMQGPAANALLKTLEEPPARTHFILSTSAPEKLLPTIRSRCQRVPFAALSAELTAELAGAENDEFAEACDSVYAAAVGNGEILAAAKAAGDRSTVVPALTGLAQRLHSDATLAVGKGEIDLARKRARQAKLVLEAQVGVEFHNAHGQLALEDLLLRIRRIP